MDVATAVVATPDVDAAARAVASPSTLPSSGVVGGMMMTTPRTLRG